MEWPGPLAWKGKDRAGRPGAVFAHAEASSRGNTLRATELAVSDYFSLPVQDFAALKTASVAAAYAAKTN